ncbi:MAG: carboxypeptidase regulatory-like domain-containing protein [Candidatus Acidiferrales bacterium]
MHSILDDLRAAAESQFLAALRLWQTRAVRRVSRRMVHAISAALAVGVGACALVPIVQAQSPGTGAVSGTILDPSSSVVNAASITVVCQEANVSRATKTSANGTFGIYLLPPGPCSLTVDAPGFQTQTVHDVAITVSETAVIDLHLALASSSTTVNVAAFPQIAQTESATLGHVVDAQQIAALPLANRNFTQILGLSPGVEVELTNAAQFGRNSTNISAAGANTTENNFQFNGIDANNIAQNSASGFQSEVGLAIPAPDTVDEFKVQTGQYSAEYGRSIGANVDMVSKAGTGEFHGSAWEFLRNDVVNSTDYFLKANHQPKAVQKQDQFGATLGGPVFKRWETYFFASYQGTTQRNGESNSSLVTTLLPPLTDDRSPAALGQLFAGQPTFFGGATVAPDGSNINPVALTLLNFKLPDGTYAIPTPQTILPAQNGQLPTGESTYSIPLRYREDQFTTNLDQKLSNRNQLAARYFHSRDETNEPFTPFSANVPGWGTQETDRNDMFVLSDTHAFSSDTINVARFGYMRFHGFSTNSSAITAAEAGMETPSGLAEMSQIDINGSFFIGPAGQPLYFQNTNSFTWQDTVSLTRGRHNLRAGAEVKRHQVAVNVPYVTTGFLFLGTFEDFLLGESAAQNGSSVSNIFQSAGASGIFPKNERYTDLAGFLQDDFHVTPRLTINVGLRYEYFGPPSEVDGRLSNFDPSIASSQVPASGSFSGFVVSSNLKSQVPAGVLRTNDKGYWNPDYKDLGPRLGFAYRISDHPMLVLRGGYGIYYQRTSGDLAEQDVGEPPFAVTQMLQGAQNADATLQQAFVPPLPPNSAYPIFLPRTPSSAIKIAAITRTVRSPASQQYSLGVQYGVTPTLLLETGYVGSSMAHLTGCNQFNQALLATPQNPVNGETATTLDNIAQRIPYEGIAQAAYICGTMFSGNYNSLQSSLTKRLGNGLSLLASYTWSKTLDYTIQETSAFDVGFTTGDQTKPRQSYGTAAFDRTNRLVLSFSYDTPRPNWGSAIVRHALSDWEFSGVLVEQSGLPITVTDSTAGSVFGNLVFTNLAECTGANPASSGSVTSRLNNFFNPAAFTDPPAIGNGTGFGNCGISVMRGPGQHNLDLGVIRNFSIGERAKLQFRSEFFNFTNTPDFGLPVSDRSTGPGVFGAITSTVENPRLIQFALKASF